MTVWKDVPGVLSADPKFYDDAVKLEQISYHDAIELTYYGATVIHPKTIKPLENKGIPMRVRSFKAPQEKGTSIGNYQATKPWYPALSSKQIRSCSPFQRRTSPSLPRTTSAGSSHSSPNTAPR